MDRILIILKKENGPRASCAPALGLNTIIFKHVDWYMQQTQVSVYRTIGPLVMMIGHKSFHIIDQFKRRAEKIKLHWLWNSVYYQSGQYLNWKFQEEKITGIVCKSSSQTASLSCVFSRANEHLVAS